MSEPASEQVSAAEYASKASRAEKASKQALVVRSASERTNRRASDAALTSGFLIVLDHSGLVLRHQRDVLRHQRDVERR